MPPCRHRRQVERLTAQLKAGDERYKKLCLERLQVNQQLTRLRNGLFGMHQYMTTTINSMLNQRSVGGNEDSSSSSSSSGHEGYCNCRRCRNGPWIRRRFVSSRGANDDNDDDQTVPADYEENDNTTMSVPDVENETTPPPIVTRTPEENRPVIITDDDSSDDDWPVITRRREPRRNPVRETRVNVPPSYNVVSDEEASSPPQDDQRRVQHRDDRLRRRRWNEMVETYKTLNCPVCLTKKSEAIICPCIHNICLSCYNVLLTADQRLSLSLRCPVCRTDSTGLFTSQ